MVPRTHLLYSLKGPRMFRWGAGTRNISTELTARAAAFKVWDTNPDGYKKYQTNEMPSLPASRQATLNHA